MLGAPDASAMDGKCYMTELASLPISLIGVRRHPVQGAPAYHLLAFSQPWSGGLRAALVAVLQFCSSGLRPLAPMDRLE